MAGLVRGGVRFRVSRVHTIGLKMFEKVERVCQAGLPCTCQIRVRTRSAPRTTSTAPEVPKITQSSLAVLRQWSHAHVVAWALLNRAALHDVLFPAQLLQSPENGMA